MGSGKTRRSYVKSRRPEPSSGRFPAAGPLGDQRGGGTASAPLNGSEDFKRNFKLSLGVPAAQTGTASDRPLWGGSRRHPFRISRRRISPRELAGLPRATDRVRQWSEAKCLASSTSCRDVVGLVGELAVDRLDHAVGLARIRTVRTGLPRQRGRAHGTGSGPTPPPHGPPGRPGVVPPSPRTRIAVAVGLLAVDGQKVGPAGDQLPAMCLIRIARCRLRVQGDEGGPRRAPGPGASASCLYLRT